MTVTGPDTPRPQRAGGAPASLAPVAQVRAWLDEQIAALLGGRPASAIPSLGTPAWVAADEALQRAAALRFARAYYEDEAATAERLHREIAAARAARIRYEHDVIDGAQARTDKEFRALTARLFEVMKARQRPYPEPRELRCAPGWPAPVIPGSGGRRIDENKDTAA